MTLLHGLDEFCGSEFWNLNLTWVTDDPDFTPCFQRTVLVWIPCIFLWLFGVYEIYSALHSRVRNIPWNFLNSTKCGISGVLIIFQLLDLSYVVYKYFDGDGSQLYAVDRYTPVIKLVTFLLVLTLDVFNRIHGIRSSGPIFLFWLILTICGIPAFRSAIRNPDANPQFQHLFNYIIELTYFPLVTAQMLLNFWADAAPLQDEHSHLVEKPRPENEASFVSRTLFIWFESLARRGYSKPLELKDLWDLNPEDSSKVLNPDFNNRWIAALDKAKGSSKSPPAAVSFAKGSNANGEIEIKKSKAAVQERTAVNILFILLKSFGTTLIGGALFKLGADMMAFAPPLILNQLIGHVQNEEKEPIWKGYFYAVLLFLATFLGTVLSSQYYYKSMLVGMRVKSTVVGAIYRKALRISNTAREESTTGEIVNLMSVDAQRLTDLCLYLNVIYSAPLQIGLSIYFLWNVLGPSVLSGLAVMILLLPLNAVLGSKTQQYQIKQMKLKDQRIKLMNEILSGIKVLKLYAWEKSFESHVMKIRGKEIKVLKSCAFLNAAFIFVWTCAPFFVSLATFTTYILLDDKNVLDAQKAFVSLTLFNVMRMPLNLLSMTIVYIIQAAVSLKRINKYMNSEEIDDNCVSHDNSETDAVLIQNGTFAWKANNVILKDVNLKVKEGSIVAIVGSVGVGKSTLLSAILGEVDGYSGRVNTKGRLAYVAQQAWIQNATVRDNILFGMPFEQSKYDRVLESCALRPDLEILPAADKTEIGEKGINLSGGQKLRLSLARATYNNADVYLLDDPLSAVDAHVGKQLFDNVIGPNGLLKRKTRLLVTHNITFLSQVDQIVVLKDGEVSEFGTYTELLGKNGAFAEFLIQHLVGGGPIDEPSMLNDLEEVIASREDFKRQISKMSESDDHGLVMRQFSKQISSLSQSQESGDGKSRRKPSSISEDPHSQSKIPKETANLIESESMESGTVKFSIIVYYMSAIGWILGLSIIMFQVMFQGFSMASNLWLSVWSTEGYTNSTTDSGYERDTYLGVYGGLGAAQGISIFVSSLITAIVTLRASGLLHLKMLTRIFKAPMSFFDTTPTGRVVNRFAKDVDVADNQIPMTFTFWLNCLLSVLGTFGIISYSTPIFITVVIPVAILYFFAQRYYVASLRQLRRLESVTRSPIYSHFGETLSGVATIRAFGVQERFMQESEEKVDCNQTCYYPSLVAGRYIAVFLELIGNVVVLCAAVFAVISRDTLSAGLVGLSVSYALQMTVVLNWLVKISSDVETNLVSVERLKEYSEIVQEAEWEIPGQKPTKFWPEDGEIIFDNYKTRYRNGLDLVLHGVTCKINPGEKVGIVGRTGAGKSSLTLGLFRIIEPVSGSITIDGHDIVKLGLHDLRKCLTIIPQDPVIFSGTLRVNLDPFNEHRDEFLWQALEQAHLKPFVKGLNSGLDYELSEGGENLSVGQRQLVCLARALLRKTKILVLDEATAAIDLDTDDIIQNTIRKEFKDSTIVTIAHRLNTIMDYTRVMVLDKGIIREFDSPQVLLEDKNSMFYAMAKDAGLA